MDLDPRNFFNLLYEHLENEATGPKECHRLLANLNDTLTQGQVNLSLLDLYLQYMCNKSNGFNKFISMVVSNKKYKACVVSIAEIIFTLVNNFSDKLERYVIVIHEICLKVIKSTLVPADEKVKWLEVLILSFNKIDKSLENTEHYTDIFNYLLKSASTVKKASSVEEKMLIALGTFAKKFQLLISDPHPLRVIFLCGLEKQMLQKDCSYKSVSGLFTGLNLFCESFPFDVNTQEDQLIVRKLCRYIDTMSVATATIKVANRAALSFLANYVTLFVNIMMEDYKRWHSNLLNWLHYGPEDQKTGVVAITSFYQGMGEFSCTDPKYKTAVLYFLDYFRQVLGKTQISNRERNLCLQGLWSFSVAFQQHLSDEEMKELLALIIHNFEQNYVLNLEPTPDLLESLPHYVQTVTKFIHLKRITNSEIFCLQKGVILMIKTFPRLPHSCHGAVVDALVSSFHFLSKNDEKLFNDIIENTIYQGVVWTCSHQHVSEAELVEEKSDKIVTIRNYLSLWRGLLGIVPVRKYDKMGIFLSDRKYLLVKIIDKLMRTLLVLINKLNVSIVLADTGAPVTDIQNAYKVAEINDFAIFLNLVDFYEDVFLEIDPTILKQCICKLIRHLIAKCVRYPLISGFYKLLSFCLKSCSKLNYFEESNIRSTQDIDICFQSLAKFVEILLCKIRQFKGDLLIACLQVLLEYPVLIVRTVLPACVPAFQTIFSVGRSYIKLTDMAIDALLHWQKEISSDEMERFLMQIVPCLDCYLQSKSLGGIQANLPQNRRKTAQMLKKRKVLVEIEPELIKLQIKILNFVGQQSSSLCQAFVSSDDAIELAVWGNKQHLKVTLSYEDIKLDVYLDKLLPRIVNLAMNSTDRKTRVTACELLQATTMVFLGMTRQMNQSNLSDVSELLNHMAVPLLRLGCDLDQVVEQLFRPLCFQLIHWYTHPRQSRSEHSAIIIEAILESISHPTDTALRDFSGKCVNEFVTWTIKQSSERQMASDTVNIKVLLSKMRFYSTHPDPYKKLGAALIFNNIYREVREESALLSIFWIEFLHVFVESLATCENNDDDDCVTQISNALAHVERGFVEKADLFNKNDSQRRIPTDLEGGLLTDVAKWLLMHTGAKSLHCRTKCMELFCSIAPHTAKYKTLQEFIVRNVSNKEDWLRQTYEPVLAQNPTSNESPLQWMQSFLCALDGYDFVVTNNLVSKKNVLSDTVQTAIQYFIANVSTKILEAEKQLFDKLRSQAILKLLQLLCTLLHNKQYTNLVYSLQLWCLVLNVIFNREALGFERFLSQEDDKKLALLLHDFLKHLPKENAQELATFLSNYVTENSVLSNVSFNNHIDLKQRNIFQGLNLLQSFQLHGFDFGQFKSGLVALLLNKFMEGAKDGLIYATDLQDTTLSYCLSIFEFALDDENEFVVLTDLLHKPYKVMAVDCNQPLNFGSYIVSLFEDSVAQRIVDKFEAFLSLSLSHQALNQTVELTMLILRYVATRKQNRLCKERVIKSLLGKWAVFETFFGENVANLELGISFVKTLLPIMKSCQLSNEPLMEWLSSLLIYRGHPHWKAELDLKIEVFYLLVDAADDSKSFSSNLTDMKNKFFADQAVIPLETKTIAQDKLFCALPKVKSAEFLTFLVDIYVKYSTDGSDIRPYLIEFILKSSEGVQKNSLFAVYEMCNSDDFNNCAKYKLATNIITLFQNCRESVFKEFFVAHISEMMRILQETTNENNLVNKIVQFLLLEVLFLRHPIQSGDDEVSPITRAALPDKPNNKIMLLKLLKCTLDATKDTVQSDLSNFIRLYKCHSYNAMVSIVSNSMKDANFYTKLFVRQENNVDILWKALIETDKQYVFETDFDNIPKRKKILLNIRDELRTHKKSASYSARYIESVRVYNSSLQEDVTRFDFTNHVVRSQLESDVEKVEVQSEIELDCTVVNSHECMANVCGLIEHVFKTNIFELPTEDDEDYVLPSWLKEIRSLLLSEQTHDNVKIFWIKVVDNTVHIFRHFAKWFLEPFLKFVVDKCAGAEINYFIADVVAILASWSTEVVPSTDSELQLASELLTFLIQHLNNNRQDIFKYHVELIRLLVETWKSSVEIPHDLIFSKLSVDPTSKQVEVGIHLSSVFLANGVVPWKENNSIEFCKTLFGVVMKSKYRSTYRPCAETVGLLLKNTSGEQNFSKIFGNVRVLLGKIKEHDKYAYVLEGLVLHYPPVADEFHLNVLFNKIQEVSLPVKAVYLKIILSRSDIMGAISDFKMERWDSYIETDSSEIQLLSLEIVYKCLDILSDCDNFKNIVRSVCKHVANSNVLCRTRMFDIAIAICQNDELSSHSEVVELSRGVLVQGITDTDLEIREKVFNFWKTCPNFPEQISKRFAYILNNLYQTDTENDFLGYSSYLLLDVIKTTEDYESMLFEHPLEDCDFEEYYLQTNWRARHMSVVPLFAETVRSGSADDFMSISNTDLNQLRRTQQSFEFAPTQSARLKQITQYTQSESSLFVKSDEEQAFVDPNLVNLSYKYQVPRRRFLKDKSKVMKFFAQREVKKSFQKTQQRKDLAKERDNKVTIYRSYRKGDLPDVQITLQAVVEPLQVLALYDAEIAKSIYMEIFNAILTKGKNDLDFMNQVATSIKLIFDSSMHFNRNLFRTLLDVLLLSKNSISLSPDLIANVCQSSGLSALGVTVLENYLLFCDDSASGSKRARGYEMQSEASCWVKLAELYRDMYEWDAVKSIFLEKLECPNTVKESVLAEANEQWQDAQDLYKNLIETDESLERKDFYYESYFKCFAHLGSWKGMVESIDAVVGGDTWGSLWDQDWNQKKLMPWYISGQLKSSIFDQNHSNQFFKRLNESLNSDHLDYLQNHYSEELAMLWIFQEGVDEAEHYIKTYIRNFLDYWQQLDSLYLNLRYHTLLKLRNVVDIQKFVSVFLGFNIDSQAKTEDLLNYWDRTDGEKLPSILFCEERVLYRRQFTNLLMKKIGSCEDELQELAARLKQVKFKLDDNILDAAIKQNNFSMTKKYIDVKSQDKLKLQINLSKLAYIKAASLPTAEGKCDILLKGCETLAPAFGENVQNNYKMSAHLQLFHHLHQISILCEDLTLFEKKKANLENITTNSLIGSPQDIAAYGAEKLKLFLSKYEDDLNRKMDTDEHIGDDYTTVANAYLELAYFAKKQGTSFSNFMLFVLRAMNFNSSEGRQLFPCILMEKEFAEEQTAQFIAETEKIPVWMFLGWIPQILVAIDSPKFPAISPIVLKIAKTYPQAIMYAYRLSKENYKNNFAQDLIKELDRILLSDERVDKFLKALSFVGIPSAILLYFVKKLKRSAQLNNTEEVKTTQKDILTELYSEKPNSSNINSLQGNMFKPVQKYEKDIKSFARLGSKEMVKQVTKIETELGNNLRDEREAKKNSHLLKDYCPWLASFSANKVDFDLEIPGQYDGKRMPLTQHHIKISGFSPNVSIMASLRKPIKVTIVGNDTKEYPFLIKFGEDIRQDQRIQQLFALMNNIFENDKNVTERGFSILTYQVIPLTTSLGIIQWIGGTTSLQDFMKKAVKDTKPFNQAGDTYFRFICRSTNVTLADAYGRAALNNSRDKTITKYRELVNSIPWDALRSAFLSLSSSTESFSALRNNFIKSYAIMCASHWLLGVGDRHLSNSLVCLKNGKILGIDFGHAFGTATQILPVPELVPFRLTPHIISLMEPLGEKGLFREVMVHCMRSLRQNTGPLLATMDVFIEEPSLDWLEHASKFQEARSSADCNWFPSQKIDQARRKLRGAKSTTVMVEDLQAGHQHNKRYMEAYIKLAAGVPEHDARARIEGDSLSVEDQVDCMIDHATDYNLLGRMFHGWAPWV